MVAIEERVHPTPFRTRKLSSPSPMILHNVMWESRPLPKIVRRPPLLLSARGGLFLCSSPCWRTVGYERFLALHVILIVPGTAGDFFVLVEKLAGRETFLEKGSPAPCPTLPKIFAGGPAQGWKVCGAAGLGVSLGKAVALRGRKLWLSGAESRRAGALS